MALARYFDKAALSLASLLGGAEYHTLRTRLESQVVGVRFDARAELTAEGRWTLELLVSMLARLYPTLAIEGTGDAGLAFVHHLRGIATGANRLVEFAPATAATLSVVVGDSRGDGPEPTLFAGSRGWTILTAGSGPVGTGDSTNPYGAGAAACIAAAWVFRRVFADFLPWEASTAPDPERLEASVLDLRTASAEPAGHAGEIDIGDAYLVGAGAIGNAAIWALARTPGLKGRLHVVDGERIDLTNVQRYVLTDEDDEDGVKPEVALREWGRVEAREGRALNRLEVRAEPYHWPEYLTRRGNYRADRALLALDSAEARIAVQASLPRWVANAWTQPENLGVSRHRFVGDGVCVACLYLPRGAVPNRDVLVGEVIGVRSEEELREVRRLLYTGEPLTADFLLAIAGRIGRDPQDLLPFAGGSLEQFYIRAACGGLLLRLGAAGGKPVEVPTAFQSAMAGILLAAELVADAGGLRRGLLPARTEINLLRPAGLLSVYPHTPAVRDESGYCLCADADFQEVYRTKYGAV